MGAGRLVWDTKDAPVGRIELVRYTMKGIYYMACIVTTHLCGGVACGLRSAGSIATFSLSPTFEASKGEGAAEQSRSPVRALRNSQHKLHGMALS